MLSQLYLTTTPLSIILIIINIVFQNMYNIDLDEESDDNKQINIEIDLNDRREFTMLIIGVFLVLFVLIVNLIIALIISCYTIRNYLKSK